MKIKNSIKALLFATTLGFMTSCGDGNSSSDSTGVVDSKKAGINEVVVHMNSDPDRLNYITGTSGVSSEVQKYVFEALMDRDPETLEFFPYLSKEVGKAEDVSFEFDGNEVNGLKYSYEIREIAKWNDGTPITGHDIAFFVKCVKNPKVDCVHLRPYLEAIVDVKVDEANPKKLSIWFKDKYFKAEETSAIVPLQKSLYDPEGLMDDISIADLSASGATAKYAENSNINRFASQFNSEEFSREKIYGSGPYEFVSWVTGERIILKKNENWWAKDLIGKEKGFINAPDKIIFEIIVDATTALTAQKDESLDIMNHRSKDYVKLKEDNEFLKKYKFELPVRPAYGYIGINTKNIKLTDKKVRKALAMSFDYETYLEVYLYGLAKRTSSPIHPLKDYYNKDIVPYSFDLEKAGALLDEAGWKDEDGNGVREKEIEGEEVPLILEFKYPSGSSASENTALMWKESLAQIGVQLDLTSREWTVYLEDTKSHNFELSNALWGMSAGLDDMKQLWHTESYNGGSNYVGFGNAETDKIIDEIRFENDKTKRDKLYSEIQNIIHDEVPYIFMYTYKMHLAFHKRFDNAKGYNVRPGYNAAELTLNNSWGAKPIAE